MKNKFLLLLTFVFIISGKIYCSDWFSPAIKFGMNFNRSQYSKEHVPEKYFYPPGFNIGISNRIKLNQMFYISNDLYYKFKKSKMHVGFGIPEHNYLTYKTKFIRFSTFLGMKHLKYIDILVGIDLGKLLRADFVLSNFKEPNSEGIREFEITNNVPSIDPSIGFGLKKQFDLVEIESIIEVVYLLGLQKYKYNSPVTRIGDKFRNHGMNFILGVKL